MKKIIFILVMLLTGLVANAQRTKYELLKDFKEYGVFYINVDNDIDNYSTLMFEAIDGTEHYDKWDKISSAVFVVKNDTDYGIEMFKRGSDWLLGKLKEAEDDWTVEYALNKVFGDIGLLLGKYTVNDKGQIEIKVYRKDAELL